MTSTQPPPRPFARRPLPPPVAVPEVLTDPEPGPPPPPPAPSSNGSVPDDGSEQATSSSTETRRIRRLLIGLGLMTLCLAGLAVWWTQTRPETTSPEEVSVAIEETLATTTTPPPLGPAIYATVIPSVVIIQTDEGTNGSIGTGVVVNEQGDILTAHHVVEGASPIRVTFADGTSGTATIVEAQPEIDIAVLSSSVTPTPLVPAVLGATPTIGEPVWAIGNPLGLGGSLSEGVISGLDRSLPIGDDIVLDGLIQFDAAVNPGSSGGPLIDRGGQVVGIVTALANPTGEDFFSGIGFAVPIAAAGGAAGGPQQ